MQQKLVELDGSLSILSYPTEGVLFELSSAVVPSTVHGVVVGGVNRDAVPDQTLPSLIVDVSYQRDDLIDLFDVFFALLDLDSELLLQSVIWS